MSERSSIAAVLARLEQRRSEIEKAYQEGAIEIGPAQELLSEYLREMCSHRLTVMDPTGKLPLGEIHFGSWSVSYVERTKQIEAVFTYEFLPMSQRYGITIEARRQVRCDTCDGHGTDEEHRYRGGARMMQDHFACEIHGDVGGNSAHGWCPACKGRRLVLEPLEDGNVRD